MTLYTLKARLGGKLRGAVRRWRSSELPVILGISFPKSGTNLLDQILCGFACTDLYPRTLSSFFSEYDGTNGRKKPHTASLEWLDSLNPGSVASAHLFARASTVARVVCGKFIPLFLIRDPRDIVVSHCFYVSDIATNHVLHSYYKAMPDFETRLTTSILGIKSADCEFGNISERFSFYEHWLHQSAVLPICFESLVNNRDFELLRIVSHVKKQLPISLSDNETVLQLSNSIFPEKSATYRSGKTGEWKRYFNGRHREIFKKVAGDLLIRLGYESDYSW